MKSFFDIIQNNDNGFDPDAIDAAILDLRNYPFYHEAILHLDNLMQSINALSDTFIPNTKVLQLAYIIKESLEKLFNFLTKESQRHIKFNPRSDQAEINDLTLACTNILFSIIISVWAEQDKYYVGEFFKKIDLTDTSQDQLIEEMRKLFKLKSLPVTPALLQLDLTILDIAIRSNDQTVLESSETRRTPHSAREKKGKSLLETLDEQTHDLATAKAIRAKRRKSASYSRKVNLNQDDTELLEKITQGANPSLCKGKSIETRCDPAWVPKGTVGKDKELTNLKQISNKYANSQIRKEQKEELESKQERWKRIGKDVEPLTVTKYSHITLRCNFLLFKMAIPFTGKKVVKPPRITGIASRPEKSSLYPNHDAASSRGPTQ